MQLTLNGQLYRFTPLKKFRTQLNLPPEFGVALFEPKNRPNLGSIEGAGPQLAAIRAQVLAAAPHRLNISQLMPAAKDIARAFHLALLRENATIGLHPPEVDFAAAGFSDVLHAVAYRLVQAQHTGTPLNFDAVYQDWLDDSVRVSAATYHYANHGQVLSVRIVNNIYGRVGLTVTTGGQTYYVQDTSQACPAASFMDDLCREVSKKLSAALVSGPDTAFAAANK